MFLVSSGSSATGCPQTVPLVSGFEGRHICLNPPRTGHAFCHPRIHVHDQHAAIQVRPLPQYSSEGSRAGVHSPSHPILLGWAQGLLWPPCPPPALPPLRLHPSRLGPGTQAGFYPIVQWDLSTSSAGAPCCPPEAGRSEGLECVLQRDSPSWETRTQPHA